MSLPTAGLHFQIFSPCITPLALARLCRRSSGAAPSPRAACMQPLIRTTKEHRGRSTESAHSPLAGNSRASRVALVVA